MFVFAEQKEPFWWDVEFPVILSNGTAKNQKVKMKFKRMDRQELIDLSERVSAREGDPIENDVDYVFEIAEDWQVQRKDGSKMEFDRENVKLFVTAFPPFMLALYKTWNTVNITGGIKEKN